MNRMLLPLILTIHAMAMNHADADPVAASGASASSVTWTGNFDDFNTAAWGRVWGVDVSRHQHGFGHDDGGMVAVVDPTSPDGHQVLRVTYKAHSSARSCRDCELPDGGQFYQQLDRIHHSDLVNASELHLRYYLKFGPNPDGSAFDFGRAGKLPGLWGGVAGKESGCIASTQGWSTRYMWRAPNKQEVYLYPPPGNDRVKCGGDEFWNGTWQADDQWHYVEQAVNRAQGTISVWYDGKLVIDALHIGVHYQDWPFGGVLFSTFYGGHDASWGPQVDTTAYFAKFELSGTYIGP